MEKVHRKVEFFFVFVGIDKRKYFRLSAYLADDRLRYIADRLCLEWRVLGKCIGLTNNR